MQADSTATVSTVNDENPASEAEVSFVPLAHLEEARIDALLWALNEIVPVPGGE